MKIKLFKALSVILILPILFLCSCMKKDKASVYFLNFKPELATAYNEIVAAYEKETGIKVKVTTAAANQYEQTLKSEIAKTDAPSIFQINGPVGYNEWKDYCADLSDTKIYNILADKSLAITQDGGVYGIPYVIEGYGIIYNDAIMKKYFSLKDKASKLSSAEEIKNFEELEIVVKDMTAHLSDLGIEGVFGSTSMASGENWRWTTHLANLPLYYEFKNEENPTSAFLKADKIDFKNDTEFKQILDLYLENSITPKNLLGSKSVADSMAEFALSKVAMIQNGNWAWSQISEVEGNTVKAEDIKFLPIYIGADGEENQGLCIGTENYFAINKNLPAEQQKASADFLYWLFSSSTGKKLVYEKLGFITPFSTFSENEQPSDPLGRQVARDIKDSSTKTVPWVFTAMPGENFKKDFGDSLLDYVQGNKEFSEVSKIFKSSYERER